MSYNVPIESANDAEGRNLRHSREGRVAVCNCPGNYLVWWLMVGPDGKGQKAYLGCRTCQTPGKAFPTSEEQ